MAISASTPEGTHIRKRKAHTKSRHGCANCKVRRVKCDERRPACRKCLAYGVACDFESTAAETSLQIVSHEPGSRHESIILLHEPPLIQMLPDTTLIQQMHPRDRDTLLQFQNRTILTIGTAGTVGVYLHEMVRLASTKPVLMHLILTLTLMHDRCLSNEFSSDNSTAEAFHWYRGTVLFNELISRPVHDSDKDALWACAVLLGAISFASIRATIPEQAWPLGAQSIEDLEWLKMSDGKKAVFKIADPNRPDSAFKCLIVGHCMDQNSITDGDIDLHALPEGFIPIFNLDDPAVRLSSPYRSPILMLSRLMKVEISHATIIRFLTFTMHVTTEYKKLLELKEPRALLILAWWFALVIPYRQWWIQQRVRLECQAICIYLSRNHSAELDVLRLLHHPRKTCGLV